MSNEIKAWGLASGITAYYILIRANGDIYSPSQGWGSFAEPYWDTFAISLTEIGAGLYYGNMPAVTAGMYSYVVYEQVGAGPDTTDAYLGSGSIVWTGSAEISGGLTAQETVNAVHNLAPVGVVATGSIGDKLNDMPATILTTAVAAYAGTPGTMGYLLSLLAGLDFTAVNLVATSDAGVITIKRSVDLVAVISGLTIPADWTECYWTVKRSTDDPDADALVQILVSNPGDPDDGVQVLAGEAVADGSDGSLVVNQAGGTVAIALGNASTDLLDEAVELVWGAKFHYPAGKVEPGAGTATITTAVTRT